MLFTSQSLSFPICKMEIIRMRGDNMYVWGRGGGAGGEAGRQGAGLGPSLALVAPAGTGVSLKCHVRSAPAPVLEIEVTET